jgi:hypothetical protein
LDTEKEQDMQTVEELVLLLREIAEKVENAN